MRIAEQSTPLMARFEFISESLSASIQQERLAGSIVKDHDNRFFTTRSSISGASLVMPTVMRSQSSGLALG
jgi:hypothetical protein